MGRANCQQEETVLERKKGRKPPNYHNLKPRLRLLVINFQSIKNKKEELAIILDEIKPDIVLGSETWLRPDIKTPEFFPNGFDVYRKDRKDKKGGGVIIAVRDCIMSEQIRS